MAEASRRGVLVFDVAPLLPPSRAAAAAAAAATAAGRAAAATPAAGGAAAASPHLVPAPQPSASLRGHPRLRDVSALAWRPCKGRELAVGVSGGVLLWKEVGGAAGEDGRGPSPAAAAPPRCLFFPVPGMKLSSPRPVAALTWSPDGRLLAGAVPGAAGVAVWDASTGAAQRVAPAAAVVAAASAPLGLFSPLSLVRRVAAGVYAAAAAAAAESKSAEGERRGGGGDENNNDSSSSSPPPPPVPPPPPLLLSWSPCGGRLFLSSSSSSGGGGGGGFTVFETERWEASVWEAPPSAGGSNRGAAAAAAAAPDSSPAVVGACWSPSGDSVLVAFSDLSSRSAVLASLAFVAPPPALGAQLLPVPLPPGTTTVTATATTAEKSNGSGGRGVPAALSWDPSRAARLALVLLEEEAPSPSVAVLLAEAAPVLAPRLVGVASLSPTAAAKPSPLASSPSSFSAARAEFAPVAPEGGFGRRGALLAVRGCAGRVALLPLGL